MIRALLFDFDGVMGDTPRAHVAAWRSTLQEKNISIEDRDVFFNEGRPAWEIAQRLFSNAGVSIDAVEAKKIAAKKNELFRSLNAGAAAGAEEILREVKKLNLRVGLVTGTVIKNLVAVLGQDLLSQFDVVVTETETERGKPNPDPYLYAARALDLTPSECLVVENAPSGLEAAKAAGMKCAALMTTLPAEYLQKADYFFADLTQLRTQLALVLEDNAEKT